MPVRPRVRYCIRTPEAAGEMYGRSLDIVFWTKRNALPELYGKLFRKASEGVMTDNTVPTEAGPAGLGVPERTPRRLRADAQRNIGSLLAAAKAVFGTAGVDAPAKEIADLAGVGVGTLYRHFPQRSDLVKAVLQHEIDACADAAPALAAVREPAVALDMWLHRYTEFLAAKRGFAAALHSGDPAFD